MKRIAVVCCLAALAGCATPPPRMYLSASGRPEAVFVGQSPSMVLGRLAGLCMDRQGVVVGQDSNQVVCQKDLEPGNALLAQFLIGNEYSTTPVLKIRFSAAQIGIDTRVQVYEWLETQMAFGQVRTIEMNNNNEFNKVEQMLIQLGGQVQEAPPPPAPPTK